MGAGVLKETDQDVINIIKKIALNIQDYEGLLEIVNAQKNIYTVSGLSFHPWNAVSLSHGLPGICMLYAELHEHFPDEGWDQLGHQFLGTLVQEISEQGLQSSSMFSGAAGVGLAAVCLSQNFKLYRKFTDRIHDYLLQQVPVMISECTKRDVTMSDYDAIEGLSGIANYLLIFSEDKKMRPLLLEVIQYLVNLTHDQEYDGVQIPGWYISAKNQFTPMEQQLYPNGNFNLGLSHGICGPIIILSKALLQGVNVPGQALAIKKMVDFLLQFANRDGDELSWKGFISFEEFKRGHASEQDNVRRDAWCYGSPGACMSLLYAGKALQERLYSDLAIQALQQTVQHAQHLVSPTFCHGYAGIVQILMAARELRGQAVFTDEIIFLKGKILSFYDDTYRFGFHNLEYSEDDGGRVKQLDYVGLLGGVTGVLLPLINIELGQKTRWDQAFML
ncbi:lanthionine synthetase C family protein [Paenibacillus sp. NRS-1782]|uniref:lanthionine synthetase C family protein n=1 Tax=unclassified Paenibacillus TaxID=185978 RepID=UPI003D2B924B